MAEVTVTLPGAQAPLPITVGPPAAMPPKSYVRIRGLPAAATLTEGHNIAAGVWAVPLVSLPNLAVRIPKGLSGKIDFRASLVSVEGNVLSEARAMLVIGPPALLSSPREVDPAADASSPMAATGLDAALARSDSGGGLHGASASRSPSDAPPAKGSFLSSFPPQMAPASPHASHTPLAPHREAELPPSANQARSLLARGIKLLSERDVAGARRFFERAADLGLGDAAMRLASTYDPDEPAHQRAPGPPPDVKMARKWYERALALGVRDAGLRLERLAAR